MIGTLELPPVVPVGGGGDWRCDIDPTGKRLAYGVGRRVIVRSLENWASSPWSAGEHQAEVVAVKFHPDGNQLAALDRAGELRFWPVTGGSNRPLRLIDAKGNFNFTFSPRGRWLAAGGEITARKFLEVWDLAAPPNTRPLTLRTDAILSAWEWAFDPTERWLVASIDFDHLAFFCLDGASSYIGSGEKYVNSMAFTHGGETLLTTAYDARVLAWPLGAVAESQPRILLQGEGFQQIVLAPDGKQVAAAGTKGHFCVVPVGGGMARELAGFSAKAEGLTVAFSPDGKKVAGGANSGPESEKVVRIWDLDAGTVQVLRPVPGAGDSAGGGIATLEFLDVNALLVGVLGTGLVRFETRDGTSTRLSSEVNWPLVLSKSRTYGFGVLVERTQSSNLLRFRLDATTATPLPAHPKCESAALDPTERILASGSEDGVVRIGPVSGEEPHLFFGHHGLVGTVAFSPDGKWVFSGGKDKTIRRWQVPDVTKTPPHMRSHQEFLSNLKSRTNLRAVPDPKSTTGWKLEAGPFPGWQKVPTW